MKSLLSILTLVTLTMMISAMLFLLSEHLISDKDSILQKLLNNLE